MGANEPEDAVTRYASLLRSPRGIIGCGLLDVIVERPGVTPGGHARLDNERLMAAVAGEYVNNDIEVVYSSFPAGDRSGMLQLRLLPSAGLDVGSLAVLAQMARSHGLDLSSVNYHPADQGLDVTAEGIGDRYWLEHEPLSPGFFVQRLAAVAADFSAAGTAETFLFRRQHGGLPRQGTGEPPWEHGLLIRLPAWRTGAFGPIAAVVTASPHGWHVRRAWPPGDDLKFLNGSQCRYAYKTGTRPILLDIALGADAAEVRAAALTFIRPSGGEPVSIPEWITVAGTAAVTTVTVPFIQAMAGRAAEDAYTALRSGLRRRFGRPAATSEPGTAPSSETGEDQADLIAIVDPGTSTELVVPPTLPAAAIRQLLRLNPDEVAGHILTWDEHTQTLRKARRRQPDSER